MDKCQRSSAARYQRYNQTFFAKYTDFSMSIISIRTVDATNKVYEVVIGIGNVPDESTFSRQQHVVSVSSTTDAVADANGDRTVSLAFTGIVNVADGDVVYSYHPAVVRPPRTIDVRGRANTGDHVTIKVQVL